MKAERGRFHNLSRCFDGLGCRRLQHDDDDDDDDDRGDDVQCMVFTVMMRRKKRERIRAAFVRSQNCSTNTN